MNETSISVVIPLYNRERQIPRAIESVISQTVQPKEILVVDDGSTDNSVSAAEQFGCFVTIIRQDNGGAAVARNTGIQAATGNWVAFLDSDDAWHPEKLEYQLKAAKKYPDAGVIFTDTRTLNYERGIVSASRFDLGGLRENAEQNHPDFFHCKSNFYGIMLTQSRVITSAAMVKRDLNHFCFPEDIWGAEDWALWLSLILETEFVAVDHVLVDMFAGDDNLTHHRGRAKMSRNKLKVLEKLLSDPRLSQPQHSSTLQAAYRVRAEAIYHSLIQGDKREARSLLLDPSGCDLSWARRIAYLAATLLPRTVLALKS